MNRICFFTSVGVALVGSLLAATYAHAANLVVPAPKYNVPQPYWPAQMNTWEVRGGIFAHDVSGAEKGSADINFELVGPTLFRLPAPYA